MNLVRDEVVCYKRKNCFTYTLEAKTGNRLWKAFSACTILLPTVSTHTIKNNVSRQEVYRDLLSLHSKPTLVIMHCIHQKTGSDGCQHAQQSSLRRPEWVSSFLTAHQHMLGYLVPYHGVVDLRSTTRTCITFIKDPVPRRTAWPYQPTFMATHAKIGI